MKNIVKIFVAAVMMLACTNAFAQSVAAGYVQSSRTVYANAPANGFFAGVGYCAEAGSGFELRPGLYYEFLTSSSSSSVGGGLIAGASKTTEHYLNVPFHLSYGYSFAPNFKMSAFAGPMASFGIASKTHATGSVLGLGGSNDLDNYADADISRFDIMVGGGVRANVGKINVLVGYDLGLLDRDKSDDVVLKRNRFTVGLEYNF